ncbi:pyridoxamine 5'-phosphate oxidase family protein [Anoxybacterium hadale]|uniref:Pyridoxamine 5'-phosphate oxidase family protein n=1 Tax=Anoxybacterium hadale TaxID=3408580 RepID=A0ACD1A665_9FIRM|nr:pyridoxamine 5'-phosphate oxidase family protein [Clostridiales bacterium]
MDYQKAATYWIEKDEKGVHMDPEMILSKMETFILAHNTCALATGCGDFVRCTPIEYNYKDRKFWLLSEGGLKFHALENNKNVCLAIFDSFAGFGQLGGMQVSGIAEIVEPWTDEYLDLLAFRKIPVENMKRLPTTMYMIKITPVRIDFLCSEFQKSGFDIRQHLYF